ncbi:MAG: class I SAM-dependent RNA methyltransferase [Brevefilum sp.]
MAESFEVKMEKLVYGGDCLGRLPDGRAVFVPFVLPGEVVRVEIVEDKQRFARAWPMEWLEISPKRIQPRCIHFGECGGCQYQYLDYEDQLLVKKNIMIDQFQRLGKITDPPVKEIVPSPNPWNYRNFVQFHLGEGSELGYIHADGEHLLPIQECHLPEPAINELWPQIDLAPESDLYRLGIRQDSYEELMLIMEGESSTSPAFSVDIPVSAVYTPSDADLTIMAGDDHLTYTLLGRNFHVSARSFFQVNTSIAEKMIIYLLKNLDLCEDSRVIELYAGVGLFSAFIAPEVGHLTAVESSGSACHDFTINLGDTENVVLYEARTEKVLPTLNIEMDLLITDPPRSGWANEVHDALDKLRPLQICYISCDPATLARDARKIIKKGYRLVSVQPFDQFPHTSHIESISIFELIMEEE